MITVQNEGQAYPPQELLYADDAALVTHSAANLQLLCTSFAVACSEFGIKINLDKTGVVSEGSQPQPPSPFMARP